MLMWPTTLTDFPSPESHLHIDRAIAPLVSLAYALPNPGLLFPRSNFFKDNGITQQHAQNC